MQQSLEFLSFTLPCFILMNIINPNIYYNIIFVISLYINYIFFQEKIFYSLYSDIDIWTCIFFEFQKNVDFSSTALSYQNLFNKIDLQFKIWTAFTFQNLYASIIILFKFYTLLPFNNVVQILLWILQFNNGLNFVVQISHWILQFNNGLNFVVQ